MNIIHTEASCGWGGQEMRILEESKGLIKRGHNVRIICPPESRIFEEGPKHEVPTVALPIGRKNLIGLRAMRRWLQKNPVDIINTHSSTDSWLASLACQTLKDAPPIVRTRHVSSPIPNNWTSRWLYTKSARFVVTTGEALRKQVIKQTGADPAQVVSIPTGIDQSRFKPGDKLGARTSLGLNPRTNYIGIVATLRSWKGHIYLLNALSVLSRPNLQLIIVGDGPYREKIEEETRKLGLEERVIMTGQRRDAENWMRCFDIFCLPSYANEGVPQALMQAMLSKIPVISTSVGSIGEIISQGKTGMIVPPKKPEALAQAIGQLLDNPVLARHLSDSAYLEAINRFGADLMAENMISIFEKSLRAKA